MKILRNVLGIIAGLIVGGAANMLIVIIGGKIIPPPVGVDMTTVDGLKAGMALLEPQHFIMPFLAHAMGALLTALVACLIAASARFPIALGLGILNLLGGIAASMMIPAPFWFKAVDLILAYIPMALIGWKLSGKK